ncbi:DUF6473 family protein [Phenylobacterium sp. LjRoot219]|uniref:DUF6473 family protein n=1 Tax=Phenylobacterium sp. LjRoot219 TaxID=3342283 RepID=UPI003ECE28AE
MAAEYQDPDRRVVDYEVFCLDPEIVDPSRFRPLRIRGPRPARLDAGEYFVCLGAAQTFGRFCARPFPTLLSQRLGLPVLNISHGGAGPSFFSQHPQPLLRYLNGARFVVLQVMSGRSEGNSRFESRGVGHYTRRSDGAELGSDAAFDHLLRTESRAVVSRVVQETRANWLSSYRRILTGLTAPTVLFWFSSRRPDYRQSYDSVSGLFGEFPQLIDADTLHVLRAECDAFVSCVSRRGLPQKLCDRETGEAVTIRDEWTATPWELNRYYPSPEMHQDAAEALEAACRRAAGLERSKGAEPSTERRGAGVPFQRAAAALKGLFT